MGKHLFSGGNSHFLLKEDGWNEDGQGTPCDRKHPKKIVSATEKKKLPFIWNSPKTPHFFLRFCLINSHSIKPTEKIEVIE